VLEDRRVDKEEGQSLFEVATRWGLSANRISEIHRDYLQRLAIAALVDGVVTDSERRDMSLVAHLLGVDHLALEGILQTAKQNLSGKGKSSLPVTISIGPTDLSGKRVCFTGECQCRLKGEAITRELATELATQSGLVVVESVTKKLDLLVVADPLTQSGKAKKAQKYGIRVMHEPVFWKVVGLAIE
jgi:DNA polymerase-3 subunit epsilon